MMRLEYEKVADIGRQTMGPIRYRLMRLLLGRKRWHKFLWEHNVELLRHTHLQLTQRSLCVAHQYAQGLQSVRQKPDRQELVHHFENLLMVRIVDDAHQIFYPEARRSEP